MGPKSSNMIGFILNTPWSVIGLLVGILSVPKSVKWHARPHAIIMIVKSLWWAVGYMKGARAVAIGQIVLLGPKIEGKDLEHELVHVEQHERTPVIQPLLYFVEVIKNGSSPKNRYEAEAYRRAGNVYKGKVEVNKAA